MIKQWKRFRNSAMFWLTVLCGGKQAHSATLAPRPRSCSFGWCRVEGHKIEDQRHPMGQWFGREFTVLFVETLIMHFLAVQINIRLHLAPGALVSKTGTGF